MTDARWLHARDNSKRIKMGWGPMAFVVPKLSKPTTGPEKAVRKAFKKELENVYMLHVYHVVEMLERAYNRGWDHGLAAGRR